MARRRRRAVDHPRRQELLPGPMRAVLGLLFMVAVSLWLLFTAVPSLKTSYLHLQSTTLRLLGLGVVPLTLWLVAFLVALGRFPRVLLRWNLWLGTLLLVPAFLGGGALFSSRLGGEVGRFLSGSSMALGIARVGFATWVALWALAPRVSLRANRRAALSFFRLLRATWRWGLRAYRRYPLFKMALRGAFWALRKIGTIFKKARPRKPAVLTRRARRMKGRRLLALPFPSSPAPQQLQPGEPEAAGDGGLPVLPQRGRWRLPPLSLLTRGQEEGVTVEENQERARLIERTLAEYGIEVTVEQIRPGPTVTLFGLVPGWVRRYKEVKERDEKGKVKTDKEGRPLVATVEERTRVKVDSILAREKDLALALAAPRIRFEAPVPGESVIGVEVPNPKPSLVTLRSVMESDVFRRLKDRAALPVALGKGSGGEPVMADLASMPHLLIAGATGSGKSVCINSIIVGLLLQLSPDQLRLVLIDPKRVELTPYNGIPHLVVPVIVEPEGAVEALRGVIHEMMGRYRKMEDLGVRNIEGYNQKVNPEERLPYLVVIIDELADLMLSAPHDVEQALCRLAQLGRATGIHLVVATQRPSVDIITGLIKANFPTRISFAVTSQADSRTILDAAGAEKLLGKGDMLFFPKDYPKPKRIQGVYISEDELERIVRHWQEQEGPPPPPIHLGPPPREEGQDEILERAKALARRHRHLSASFLQRRLNIGRNRAVQLLEELEEEGLLRPGQADGDVER